MFKDDRTCFKVLYLTSFIFPLLPGISLCNNLGWSYRVMVVQLCRIRGSHGVMIWRQRLKVNTLHWPFWNNVGLCPLSHI